jgi:hypothetical protein
MRRINALHVRLFWNALHVQCMQEILEKTLGANPDALKIRRQYDNMLAVFEREKLAFTWLRKNEITERKAEADHARDACLSGLHETVKAAQFHFNPQVAEAGRRIRVLIDNYNRPVPMSKQTYDSETAAIQSFLRDMLQYGSEIALLGIQGWLEALEARNLEFEALTRELDEELLDRPSWTMREARMDTDRAMHTLFHCVEALMEMEDETLYTTYVRVINILIKHFNDVCAQHRGYLPKSGGSSREPEE